MNPAAMPYPNLHSLCKECEHCGTDDHFQVNLGAGLSSIEMRWGCNHGMYPCTEDHFTRFVQWRDHL
jgi:hypothetical protein